MIVLKSIEMTLDRSSITKAIREIELFERQLKPAMTHLIESLIEEGAEIAKAELFAFEKPAFDYGELYESIGSGMQSESEGVVTTGIMYAVYVEYGTGEYAAGGDGRQGGWTYYDTREGRFRHTYGMAARPFMYNTYVKLRDVASNKGARIIAEYLAG